jgi:hypothetical protein
MRIEGSGDEINNQEVWPELFQRSVVTYLEERDVSLIATPRDPEEIDFDLNDSDCAFHPVSVMGHESIVPAMLYLLCESQLVLDDAGISQNGEELPLIVSKSDEFDGVVIKLNQKSKIPLSHLLLASNFTIEKLADMAVETKKGKVISFNWLTRVTELMANGQALNFRDTPALAMNAIQGAGYE